MWENRKKIGIMGGTFDPIHIGHLILGEIAYEQFQLDKVLFMPAGNPPHKKNRKDGASNQQRVEMVKRAIASNPHFELSLVEMDKITYTYTYKTLEELKKQNLCMILKNGKSPEGFYKHVRFSWQLETIQAMSVQTTEFPFWKRNIMAELKK